MLKRMTGQCAIVCALCLLGATACGGNSSTIVPQNYTQEAAEGVATLQTTMYNSSTGLYGTGWWNAANSITVLVDYTSVTGDTTYESAIANTFNNANKANKTTNFLNSYDDDEGWWALAWIDAYDLTGTQAYLTMAETIFANIASEWDTTTCGGGVWWEKPAAGVTEYKNAITNELFLTVAAKLANRTTGTASAGYLSWAQQEWTWFKASGMINPQNLINDGLTATSGNACINNGKPTYTYNQGVILGGLVELSKADQDSTLLPQAEAIANAAIANLAMDGVLVEPTGVSGGDAPQFKGIFMRNLVALYKTDSNPHYKTFIETNANSIWTNDLGRGNLGGGVYDYEFGGFWQGPFDSSDATRQTSALDALIAAAEVQ